MPPSPEITCLSPTPPGSLGARFWGGRAFRKTIRIDRAVLYLLQSTVVKKLETQGQREAEGRSRGDPDALPRDLGGPGSGMFAIYIPPSLAQISRSFPVPEIQRQARGRSRGGAGWGEGVSARGRLCTRGRSGQSYAEPPGTATLPSFCRVSGAAGRARGVPSGCAAARCLRGPRRGPRRLPRGPVPPGVPCVPPPACRGTRVCAEPLPGGASGRRNP